MASVGQRVRIAMEIRHIGFNELERLIGHGPGFVSRLVREPRRPRADTLSKLAKALGVHLAWLIDGDGPMLTDPDPASDRDVITASYAETHPQLVTAIKAARILELNETAVKRVEATWDQGADQPAHDWLADIYVEQRRLLRRRAQAAGFSSLPSPLAAPVQKGTRAVPARLVHLAR